MLWHLHAFFPAASGCSFRVEINWKVKQWARIFILVISSISFAVAYYFYYCWKVFRPAKISKINLFKKVLGVHPCFHLTSHKKTFLMKKYSLWKRCLIRQNIAKQYIGTLYVLYICLAWEKRKSQKRVTWLFLMTEWKSHCRAAAFCSPSSCNLWPGALEK